VASPISYSDPVQLVHKADKRVIVKFPQGIAKGIAEFGAESQILAEAMKTTGIRLDSNHGKVVYLGDANFGKAFYEVYFKHAFKPPEDYQWMVVSSVK
jgi:hypothetical protein